MNPRLQTALRWPGPIGFVFAAMVLAYAIVSLAAPGGGWLLLTQFGVVITGVWLSIRLLRLAAKHAVWRLRNRLLVTYLFIAVVPILLAIGLAALGGYLLVSQLAVYLLTSELDRRIDTIQSAAQNIARAAPEDRPAMMQQALDLVLEGRFPGSEILWQEPDREVRVPESPARPGPPGAWPTISGVVLRDGRAYLWSHVTTQSGAITITAPLTRDFLSGLAPKLGLVDIGDPNLAAKGNPNSLGGGAGLPRALPPARNRFDREIVWFATLPASNWDRPGKGDEAVYLGVRSRVSAVLGTVFNRESDVAQGVLQIGLIAGAIVFVLVEIVSWIIGLTMTRTITGAVHRLYEGTQKIMQGDFSHRIQAAGADQLAELSHSFNRMTENLERLLVVAKEKERLESEIEIAREVQKQLFPRGVPEMPTLRICASCQPARMVSGDYYDYELMKNQQVALAIGDVAGKGISAALLMASLQSCLRTQLQSAFEAVIGVGNGHAAPVISTSRLVSRLNLQLHSTTSPEKYATFCLGVYDEPTSSFTYTNAGHLPPLLVRDGKVDRLDVNGTVVGAFPFSEYGESRVALEPGDLLVCYTDGITEPENEYGEMFGEDRLCDLLARNAHRPEEEIVEELLSCVRQWTGAGELQDDMTLLMARRL